MPDPLILLVVIALVVVAALLVAVLVRVGSPAAAREAARARGCGTMTGAGMFEAVRDRMVNFYLDKAAR